jgi:hypothetical protein
MFKKKVEGEVRDNASAVFNRVRSVKADSNTSSDPNRAHLLTQEEEDLMKIINEFEINVSERKLPYHLKIKQICASVSAFQRYKRDQRELLDFSILKSKDYIDK